jgi:hypothetical protein
MYRRGTNKHASSSVIDIKSYMIRIDKKKFNKFNNK